MKTKTVTTIDDAMKKYWPECLIEYRSPNTFMPYGVFMMLVNKMKARGATKEELEAVMLEGDTMYNA